MLLLLLLLLLCVLIHAVELGSWSFGSLFGAADKAPYTEDPLRTWLKTHEPTKELATFFAQDKKMREQKKMVLFLHIPKTAGQSFHRFLSVAMNMEGSSCLIDLKSEACVKHKQSKSQPLMRRFDPVFAASQQHHAWMHNPEQLARLHLRGLIGHFDMSITEVFPEHSLAFFTVLRDPKKRLISWYTYLKSNTEDIDYCLQLTQKGELKAQKAEKRGRPSLELAHDQVEDGAAKLSRCKRSPVRKFANRSLEQVQQNQRANWNNLTGPLSWRNARPTFGPSVLPSGVSFKDFIKKMQLLKMDNYVTRALAGAHNSGCFYDSDRRKPLDDASMLQLAKDVLRKFSFVGILERFDETLRLFEKVTQSTQLQKLIELEYNKTPRKHDVGDGEWLKEIDWMDFELYELANNLFEEQLKAARS